MTTCPDIPLLLCCIVGGVLAGVIQYISIRQRDLNISVLPILQIFAAGSLGFGIGGTVHSMYGAICPRQLVDVQVLTADKKVLEAPVIEISVKMEAMHKADILLGSAFLLYLSYRGLKTLYRNPDHL